MNKLKATILATVAAALGMSHAAAVQEPRKPDFEMKVLLSGRYKCVLNEGTERESATPWFKNLITDIGLDRLGTASPTVFQWGSIGTGNTAPANSNTSLVAYVASTSNVNVDSQSNLGASTYLGQCQFHHTYAQGAVVGNMAEIGIGWASGGVSLWSRALILDSGGSPTTLTVTGTDQLTVYYELTCAPVLTDITGTASISGTSYNYTGRIATCNNFANSLYSVIQSGSSRWGSVSSATTYVTQVLGAITGQPAGAGAGGGSGAAGTYTNGNKYLDSTYSWAPGDGNASGGVGSVFLLFGAPAQFQYTLAATSGGAVVPKDATKTMTMVFRFAWDRV